MSDIPSNYIKKKSPTIPFGYESSEIKELILAVLVNEKLIETKIDLSCDEINKFNLKQCQF